MIHIFIYCMCYSFGATPNVKICLYNNNTLNNSNNNNNNNYYYLSNKLSVL